MSSHPSSPTFLPRDLRPTALATLALLGLVFVASSVVAKPDGPRVTLTPLAGVGVLSEFSGVHDDVYLGGAVGFMFDRHWGVEGTLGYVPSIQRSEVGDPPLVEGGRETRVRHLSADLRYLFWPERAIQPYLTAGWSQLFIDPDGQSGAGDAEGFGYGAGILFPISDGPFHRWSARVDFKHSMVEFDDVGVPDDGYHHNLMFTAGVQFEFGDDWHKDLDSDGVIDRFDDCLGTPSGVVVDSKGCPIDSDQDGIFDGLDQCEGTPVGATVDSLGCPSDADGDGVFDGIDECAATPEGARIDEKGCPLDSDDDGVYDGLDDCPDTPAGIGVDLNGCPRIESEPERDFYNDERMVLDDVRFLTGKAEVTSGITASIRLLARIMQKWPDIRVEIGGYTDSAGSDATNLQLSQERAEAVRDYLIERFQWITEDRITAVGYGEANPIADNSTEMGREQNRRVEARLLEGGPGGY